MRRKRRTGPTGYGTAARREASARPTRRRGVPCRERRPARCAPRLRLSLAGPLCSVCGVVARDQCRLPAGRDVPPSSERILFLMNGYTRGGGVVDARRGPAARSSRRATKNNSACVSHTLSHRPHDTSTSETRHAPARRGTGRAHTEATRSARARKISSRSCPLGRRPTHRWRGPKPEAPWPMHSRLTDIIGPVSPLCPSPCHSPPAPPLCAVNPCRVVCATPFAIRACVLLAALNPYIRAIT